MQQNSITSGTMVFKHYMELISSRSDRLMYDTMLTMWAYREFDELEFHYADTAREALYFCDDEQILKEFEVQLNDMFTPQVNA